MRYPQCRLSQSWRDGDVWACRQLRLAARAASIFTVAQTARKFRVLLVGTMRPKFFSMSPVTVPAAEDYPVDVLGSSAVDAEYSVMSRSSAIWLEKYSADAAMKLLRRCRSSPVRRRGARSRMSPDESGRPDLATRADGSGFQGSLNRIIHRCVVIGASPRLSGDPQHCRRMLLLPIAVHSVPGTGDRPKSSPRISTACRFCRWQRVGRGSFVVV